MFILAFNKSWMANHSHSELSFTLDDGRGLVLALNTRKPHFLNPRSHTHTLSVSLIDDIVQLKKNTHTILLYSPMLPSVSNCMLLSFLMYNIYNVCFLDEVCVCVCLVGSMNTIQVNITCHRTYTHTRQHTKPPHMFGGKHFGGEHLAGFRTAMRRVVLESFDYVVRFQTADRQIWQPQAEHCCGREVFVLFGSAQFAAHGLAASHHQNGECNDCARQEHGHREGQTVA